nr:MAG TPA: hypothetical protein [Caudoviricetes sp.]
MILQSGISIKTVMAIGRQMIITLRFAKSV